MSGYCEYSVPHGARLSEEHGWLCIRTESGFLLWSSKLTDIPASGYYLSGILSSLNADRPTNPRQSNAALDSEPKEKP